MADDPASIPSQNFVPLRGSHRELLPASRPAGSIDPTEVVSVTVRTLYVRGRSTTERLLLHLHAPSDARGRLRVDDIVWRS